MKTNDRVLVAHEGQDGMRGHIGDGGSNGLQQGDGGTTIIGDGGSDGLDRGDGGSGCLGDGGTQN